MPHSLSPENESNFGWFYDSMRADPVSTVLAFQATAGDLFQNLLVWEGGSPERSQQLLGPVMAYYLAHMSEGTLDRLDTEAPVTHEMHVIQPPSGLPPVEVAEAVVGVRVVARQSLGTDETVNVHPLDYQLGIYWQGRVGAAAWYRSFMNDRLLEGKQVPVWQFDPQDVVVEPREYDGRHWGNYLNPYSHSLLGVLNTLHVVAPFDSMSSKLMSIAQLEADRLARVEQMQAFDALPEIEKNRAGIQHVLDAISLAAAVRDTYYNNPSTSWARSSYNAETGQLERYVANGQVLFDREAGIDESTDTVRYSEWAQSPAQLEAAKQRDENVRRMRPDIQAIDIDPDEYDWHLNRIGHGL